MGPITPLSLDRPAVTTKPLPTLLADEGGRAEWLVQFRFGEDAVAADAGAFSSVGAGGLGCYITVLQPEDALMHQAVLPLVLTLSLFLVMAIATHLVMSFGQTLIHYKVAHHPMGGTIFRNHINFHHTHYSDDHLVSLTYLGDEGNTTPYFFIPIFVVGGCAYFLLPLNLFVVMVIASAASFYAHIYFDKEYHSEKSWLQPFAWFRRKQELHFIHHRHADSNYAVIHFFWDRILGTYRKTDAG